MSANSPLYFLSNRDKCNYNIRVYNIIILNRDYLLQKYTLLNQPIVNNTQIIA